jgi:hypothetical protein
MRLARREGKSFGSQGPQAKTKLEAEIFSAATVVASSWSLPRSADAGSGG